MKINAFLNRPFANNTGYISRKNKNNNPICTNTETKSLLNILNHDNYTKAQISFTSNNQTKQEKAALEDLCENLGITSFEAHRYYDNFAKKYPTTTGLNSVKGFSTSKYRLAMGVIKPIEQTNKSGLRSDANFVPRGVLLYGSQSSGKEYIIKKLLEDLSRLGCNLQEISFKKPENFETRQDLDDANTQIIRNAFQSAQEEYLKTKKCSVIFFPKLDCSKEAMNEIVKQAGDLSKKGVMWISSIPDLDEMNPAMLIDEVSTIAMPILQTKNIDYQELVNYFLEKYNTKQKSLNFFKIDKAVEALKSKDGVFTMGDIARIVNKAITANIQNNRLCDTPTFLEAVDEYYDSNIETLKQRKTELQKDNAYVKAVKESNNWGRT